MNFKKSLSFAIVFTAFFSTSHLRADTAATTGTQNQCSDGEYHMGLIVYGIGTPFIPIGSSPTTFCQCEDGCVPLKRALPITLPFAPTTRIIDFGKVGSCACVPAVQASTSADNQDIID